MKTKIIKISMWLLLAIFILWLLYNMFLKEYQTNKHLIKFKECQNDAYNCICNLDNGNTCSCKAKKLWIEYDGLCSKEILKEYQITESSE